jgi:hypothetical protein
MYHFIEEYHCMANVNIYNDKIIFSSMGCSIYTYIVSSNKTGWHNIAEILLKSGIEHHYPNPFERMIRYCKL